ncbi:hypothetical protein ScalyP_jg10814 [Parmales sp. scaly parma]|nr:hypothetical protein ScalyP_jg10814 [Parmales sp. scaly parma]
MFTGIIEEMGSITNLIKSSVPSWEDPTKVVPGYTFTISSPTGLPLQDAYLGASIAVSGICLTATSLDPQTKTFSVGVAAETLRLTTLGPIVDEMEAAGGTAESYPANVHPVNLERAAAIGGRNSGHNVQGHVDCVATITEKRQEGDSIVYKLAIDNLELQKFIVSKGFVAVDGVSLTVCETGDGWFTIMMVRHTQDCVTMGKKEVGEKVNIETDCIAKYSVGVVSGLEEKIERLEKRVRELEVTEFNRE